MPHPRTADNPRPLPKAISAEDIAHGTARLQEVLAAINDFSQEGFPYRDAARSKAELQLRECVKQIFGEESHEFHTYRNYRLRTSNKAETTRSIAAIKELLQALEDRKSELLGSPSPTASFSATAKNASLNTAQMRLVPPATQTEPAPEPPRPPLPSTVSPAVATNPRMPAAPIAQPSSPAPAPKAEKPHAKDSSARPSPPLPKAAPGSAIPAAPPVAAPSPSATQEIRPAPAPPPQDPATPAQATPLQPTPPLAAPAVAAPSPSATQQIPPAPAPPIAPTPAPTAVHTIPDAPSFKPDSEQESLQLIRKVCLRLHTVARQLRLRKDSRPTLEVEDDHDLQDLLRALLKMQFDEVGVDEWTPPYAGSAPKTALLLNREQIVVVAKKTRPGLTTKEIAEQVTADSAFYSARNKCTTLFCFVYDPEGRIGNPTRLETDLTSVSTRYTVEVLVEPK